MKQLADSQDWLYQKPSKKVKGKDLDKLVGVPVGDENNTIIYAETKEEALRVKPKYKERLYDRVAIIINEPKTKI